MKALVIFSGGQDSTTCLGYAVKEYEHVEAINFNYGQKHSIEIYQARIIADAMSIKLHEVDISFLGELVDSALTSSGDVNQPHERLKHLPASFVPNRNALFITLAHALAQKIYAKVLITGVCQTDFSGYPDCREEFIRSIESTLKLGSETDIQIVTPLMNIDKAGTFRLATVYGCLDLVINESHTCYNGNRFKKFGWGYGCDSCPACEIRKNGWNEYQESLDK